MGTTAGGGSRRLIGGDRLRPFSRTARRARTFSILSLAPLGAALVAMVVWGPSVTDAPSPHRSAGSAPAAIDSADPAAPEDPADTMGASISPAPIGPDTVQRTPAPKIPSLEPEQLTGYVWPLRGARITGWFEYDAGGFVTIGAKRVHDGLDLATFCGHRVVAAHGGTVLYAGRRFDEWIAFDGPLDRFYERVRADGDWLRLPRVVVIDDGNGYRSVYAHLGSQSVKAGEIVKAGDPIGKEGATGRASGCHLHYELIRMDGPWMPVAPELVRKWRYPASVRERVDPMRVLSFKLRGHARRIPGLDPPTSPLRYEPPTPRRTPRDRRLWPVAV